LDVPGDDRLWMSDLDRTPEKQLELSLGTLEGDDFVPRVRGKLPLKTADYVTASLLYFDTATGRLRFAYLEGHGERPVTVFEARGEHLELVPTTGAGPTRRDNALSYDPTRSVLVHVRISEHGDERGVRLRELHDGTWCDVGDHYTPVGSKAVDVWAAWENARQLTVVVDSAGATAGWDGSRWHLLPALAGGCGRDPHFARTGEGYLSVVFQECATGSRKKLLRVLGPDRWLKHDWDGLVLHGPGAFHPRAKQARYLGTIFKEKGSCHWGEVEVDGEQVAWRLVPPYLPSISDLVVHDGRLLISDRHAMYRTVQDGCVPCAAPEPSLLGLVGGSQIHAVGLTGNVYLRTGDSWTIQPSEGLEPYEDVALARRPDGTIVLCGGRLFVAGRSGFGRVVRQLWSWDGNGWTKLAVKGRQPEWADALAAWDERRSRLIVTGGKNRHYQREPLTYEFDGKRWQRFDDGPPTQGHVCLAYDGPTGILFAVAYKTVSLYRGDGRWDERRAPYDTIWGPYAFDPALRQLWCVSYGGGIAKFDLGPWLDSVATELARLPALEQEGAEQVADMPGRRKPRAKPGPVERYLRCTDDGADKFWIAKVKGKTITLHWGRRGRQGQRKSIKHDNGKVARVDFDKRVAKKLDAGYWDAPEKDKACELPGRWAYEMHFDRRGVDVIGGMPRISARRWPKCTDCSKPMSHVMTLRRHTKRLALHKHAGLAVFMCLNEETAGCCETFEPFAGANAVLLLSEKEMKSRPRHQPPANASPPVERLAIRYQRTFEPDPISEDIHGELDDKVGGYPVWYQQEHVPKCPSCGVAMRFVAQLNEVAEPLNFGGGGVAYLFLCPDEHGGAVLWQCG